MFWRSQNQSDTVKIWFILSYDLFLSHGFLLLISQCTWYEAGNEDGETKTKIKEEEGDSDKKELIIYVAAES